mmetsp:Transcript_5328/g.11688  ORF Transcript_5328/g.11688 Transcript_5328/m.11688 type:complete len:301 (+) Transcript_5328:29-931(+)
METSLVASEAPRAMTMDRVGETKQIIVAQSTSQCCRAGCCQPSINWVLREADNYHGGNPHKYQQQAWIHEESTFCMRCNSCWAPGCREVKYVQHSSTIPESVVSGEDFNWCTVQRDLLPKGLTEEDRNKDVIATHEKTQTCTACCCYEPYLETKDASGKVIGSTQYVCDWCIFVPKFDIFDGSGTKKYRLRPDTCIGGLCIMCRCGGPAGKCCRVPFIVRDPNDFTPIKGNSGNENAQVTELWSGWKNECCTLRNAYHIVFPDDATPEDRLTLIGSSILIDVLYAEQNNDDGGGGGGGGG